jgi:Cleft lip and palate transmembrane protein 1 (CLPTM1)
LFLYFVFLTSLFLYFVFLTSLFLYFVFLTSLFLYFVFFIPTSCFPSSSLYSSPSSYLSSPFLSYSIISFWKSLFLTYHPPSANSYILSTAPQLLYKPPIHADEIGLTTDKYIALNETVSWLPLQISYAPLSLQVDSLFITSLKTYVYFSDFKRILYIASNLV